MGLFSKKEDVPEIPSAPTLPELPKIEEKKTGPEKKDLPELPVFPANSKNEDINQEMVKSAVSDMPSPGEEEVVDAPKEIHKVEEPKEESAIPPVPSQKGMIPSIQNLPKEPVEKKQLELRASESVPTSTKNVEPIYVRIDKFQSAQKDFEQIKDKVKEIESVLKKIKDVKAQEETELKGWTEDIEKIKSRLAEVDSGIFNQI